MGILTFEQKENIIKATIKNLQETKKGKVPPSIAGWGEDALTFRRQAIMELMGKGKSRTKIVNEISERWNVSKVSAYIYVKDVNQFLTDSYKEESDHLKDIIFHKLECLAEDALEHNDRKSALKAYEDIARMGGLYEEKVKLENNTTIKFDFGGEGN
jgi:hypothetical protein